MLKMNQKELHDYFLAHLDDTEAFYAYVDKLHAEENWIEMPPLELLQDLEIILNLLSVFAMVLSRNTTQ